MQELQISGTIMLKSHYRFQDPYDFANPNTTSSETNADIIADRIMKRVRERFKTPKAVDEKPQFDTKPTLQSHIVSQDSTTRPLNPSPTTIDYPFVSNYQPNHGTPFSGSSFPSQGHILVKQGSVPQLFNSKYDQDPQDPQITDFYNSVQQGDNSRQRTQNQPKALPFKTTVYPRNKQPAQSTWINTNKAPQTALDPYSFQLKSPSLHGSPRNHNLRKTSQKGPLINSPQMRGRAGSAVSIKYGTSKVQTGDIQTKITKTKALNNQKTRDDKFSHLLKSLNQQHIQKKQLGKKVSPDQREKRTSPILEKKTLGKNRSLERPVDQSQTKIIQPQKPQVVWDRRTKTSEKPKHKQQLPSQEPISREDRTPNEPKKPPKEKETISNILGNKTATEMAKTLLQQLRQAKVIKDRLYNKMI